MKNFQCLILLKIGKISANQYGICLAGSDQSYSGSISGTLKNFCPKVYPKTEQIPISFIKKADMVFLKRLSFKSFLVIHDFSLVYDWDLWLPALLHLEEGFCL